MDDPPQHDDDADALLERALLDPDASAAVALRIAGLALSDALTVVFHGRRDLGTTRSARTPAGTSASTARSSCGSRWLPTG